MIVALALLTFAVLAATSGSRLLGDASWPTRSPGLGMWAWQALSLSVASAIVLAGAVLAVAATPLHHQIAGLLRSCSDALAAHYAAPGGMWTAVVALSLSALVVSRFLVLVGRSVRGAAAQRKVQRDGLALLGVPHPDGFTLVEHHLPLVYCVPGRRNGTIVVTTAALDALSPDQLGPVLAHERKHLRFRHHVAMTISAALSRTFRGVSIFGIAHDHICSLAEMHADDAVHGGRERRNLGRALLSLSPAAPQGSAVLASAGRRTTSRVLRLADGPVEPRRGRGMVAGLVGLATLAVPLAVALGPAVESAARDCCMTAVDLPRHYPR